LLDYAFFDAALARRFADAAAVQGVECRLKDDVVAGWIASLPDDLPEAIQDALDDFYEVLVQEQAAMAESVDGWVTKRLAGVQVQLADGRLHTVRLDPETANRLLAAFTPEEAQALVQSIVRSLEDPFEGPLCRTPDP